MISIDPGVNKSGVAVWFGQVLTHADYRKINTPLLDPLAIIEVPQIYQGRKQKGDPNDLITLAVEVGYIKAQVVGDVLLVKPREWKGQVPKMIMVRRILEKLTARELDILGYLKSNHNVVDAVGIGLWRLGRL